MKKGCVIALIVFAVLVAVTVYFGYRFGLPRMQSTGTAGVVFTVETALDTYAAEYGEVPEGDHAQVVTALRGNNEKEINFLGSDIDGHVVDGKVVDLWRNPLEMERSPGAIRFSSAGPNGEHGDDDDVTSQGLRNLVDKIEEKAAKAATESESSN